MTSQTDPDDERRAEPRHPKNLPVRLSVDSAELSGISENISGVGVLFFTDSSLKVTVEIHEDGAKRKRTGRLVRVQRMSLDSTGFAVEFDPE
jgi:hypothetical protein